MDDLTQVKQSVKRSFLQQVIITLCGLELYLGLVGDHYTIMYAMYHSSSSSSGLLLTYPSYHGWQCTQLAYG